jgi:hypothetical protein
VSSFSRTRSYQELVESLGNCRRAAGPVQGAIRLVEGVGPFRYEMVGIGELHGVVHCLPACEKARRNGCAWVEGRRPGEVRVGVKEDQRHHPLTIGVPIPASPGAVPRAALTYREVQAAGALAQCSATMKCDQRVDRGTERGIGRAVVASPALPTCLPVRPGRRMRPIQLSPYGPTP